jgi:site-specific DNA-adenine methylase
MNGSRLKSPVSYYGGKGPIVHRYSTPQFKLIIEPFAGSAAYAFRHAENHDVWINDVDARTFSMWQFLTSPDAADVIRQYFPLEAKQGDDVTKIVPVDKVPEGFIEVLRAQANMGSQGARGVHNVITKFGVIRWKIFYKQLMTVVVPRVKNWKVTNLSYAEMETDNVKATYFVDPPYQNAAGSRYRHSSVDYEHLAQWCRTRHGQVIVCENHGANWLPFGLLYCNWVGVRRRDRSVTAGEVVWEKTPQALDFFFGD